MTELPKFYRSFPSPSEMAEKKLDNVPHIVDNLPKLLMSDHNYKSVGDHRMYDTNSGWPEDLPGICILEWDIALDSNGMIAFGALAIMEPREVLVAPYRWNNTWIHFVGNDGRGPTPESRPVHPTDRFCDSFGMGCIYIPRDILVEFLGVMDHLGWTDYTFGYWYRQKYGPARLTWDVHPQHVHYYDL